MKKLVAIAVLVLVLVLVLQLAASAVTPPPPPPPTKPPPAVADCSPGFWKNHTELWYDDPQWDDPALMLEALRAKGNSPLRPLRAIVAEELNEAYPDTVCD